MSCSRDRSPPRRCTRSCRTHPTGGPATRAARARGPLVADWSSDARRGGLGLHRTAVASLKAEVGNSGGPGPSGPAQLARLAFPVGLGAQGALLAQGIPVVRVSGSGELAPPKNQRKPSDLNTTRYGEIGRSLLRIVSALDIARIPPAAGSRAYVNVGKQVLPGWALALVAATLILPALIASVDALARARRRGQPVVRWLIWVAAGVVPFLAALGVGKLLVIVGAARDAPAALDPSAAPVDGKAAAAVAGVARVAGRWRCPSRSRRRPRRRRWSVRGRARARHGGNRRFRASAQSIRRSPGAFAPRGSARCRLQSGYAAGPGGSQAPDRRRRVRGRPPPDRGCDPQAAGGRPDALRRARTR